jgi:hypothetical protein
MSMIPVDLERKIEQRWVAARLARPVLSAAPERHCHESQPEPLAAPVEAKRKTRQRVEGALAMSPLISGLCVVTACVAFAFVGAIVLGVF